MKKPTPENGNTQAETVGDGNSRDCTCMGNETRGAVRARGATQGGEAVTPLILSCLHALRLCFLLTFVIPGH
jgi:hypothetical protein